MRNGWLAAVATAVTLCALGVVGAAQQSSGSPQTSGARGAAIGPFKVSNPPPGWLEFIIDPKGKTTVFDFHAGPGQKVKATTVRYDMAASRIELTLNNQSNKVPNGRATGGVRIEARDPERNQMTELTCDTATYAGAAADTPPRINVAGNVRSVLRGPQFDPSDPFVTTAESGFVEFLNDGRIRVKLLGSESKGTLIEPAPKKKP